MFAWISVHTCVQEPMKDRKRTGFPETGVADDGELACGCWEQNPSLLHLF